MSSPPTLQLSSKKKEKLEADALVLIAFEKESGLPKPLLLLQRKRKQVIKHVLDQAVTFCCTNLKHSGRNTVLIWRMTRDVNHDISSIFA